MSIICFRVDKGSSDAQTIADNTLTLMTWSVEQLNVGGYFSSNKWTPPAAIVSVTASVWLQPVSGSLSTTNNCGIAIYKNGALFAQTGARQFAASANATITVSDNANGTDFYEAYALADHATSGTSKIKGDANITYFSGRRLS